MHGSTTNSATTVNNGGTLGGNGTTGTVSVASGGTLAPGASTGILKTGNLVVATGGILKMELNGATVGSGHDQIKVTGTVSLSGATLDLDFAGGFNPATGTVMMLIDNDGTDAISGLLAGLAEGARSRPPPG